MIVIFASPFDNHAKRLAAVWADHDVRVLSSRDLSSIGWRHYVGCADNESAVISGEVVSVDIITGVLVRWPGVFVQELTHISQPDREYVAGEMTAFLVSWLSSLKCPVINRPTPLQLTGPLWRREQWIHAAARLGIPVRAYNREVTRDTKRMAEKVVPLPTNIVTVVGSRRFGSANAALLEKAGQLAELAGVCLVELGFDVSCDDAHFVDANLTPDINGEAAEAVLELLTS
jgi:hypothetical protein